MVGTFLVAAELAERGYIPLLTSRNTKAADIVVFSEETSQNVNVQVKTNGFNTSDNFWLLGQGDLSPKPSNFFYVLVKLRAKPVFSDFYIMPANLIRKLIVKQPASTGSVWYVVFKKDALPYKEKWQVIIEALSSKKAPSLQ